MADNKRQLVSTIGYQYFGKGADGSDKSLSVAYLENNISIGIFDLLPPSQQTERSKFDYKSGHQIYLKGKQAKTLARLIKKAYANMCEGKDIDPLAINSADNLIEVASGNYYGASDGIAIAIYNEVKPDKTATKPAIFIFGNESLIKNYDYKAGTYEHGTIDADIDYIVDQLTEFAKGITNARSHCIKKEMNFNMNRFTSRQIQMCKALGINLETPRSARTDWNSGNSHSSGSVLDVDTESLLNELNG